MNMATAQFWTIIGVMIAGFSVMAALFLRLDAKIESVRSELDAKIESVRSELDAKIESVRSDVTHLAEAVGRIEGKLDEHLRTHASMSA